MKKTIKSGMVTGVFFGTLTNINKENFLISIAILVSILLFIKLEPYFERTKQNQ